MRPRGLKYQMIPLSEVSQPYCSYYGQLKSDTIEKMLQRFKSACYGKIAERVQFRILSLYPSPFLADILQDDRISSDLTGIKLWRLVILT